MPTFQSTWQQLADYVATTYPGTGMACNAHGLVANVSNDAMAPAEFDAMMEDLQARFTDSFHSVVNEVPPPPPPAKPTKDCPACGETILAIAKKCRYCHSDLTAA